ncbi:uncharacterized protein V1510DRAFT_419367 [Dipodascopsis tothii]|uniref:uncharacterized protein n=1 Tax=Dipodascopsis tothii TaxID=44089 RepID=UPI0034CD0651
MPDSAHADGFGGDLDGDAGRENLDTLVVLVGDRGSALSVALGRRDGDTGLLDRSGMPGVDADSSTGGLRMVAALGAVGRLAVAAGRIGLMSSESKWCCSARALGTSLGASRAMSVGVSALETSVASSGVSLSSAGLLWVGLAGAVRLFMRNGTQSSSSSSCAIVTRCRLRYDGSDGNALSVGYIFSACFGDGKTSGDANESSDETSTGLMDCARPPSLSSVSIGSGPPSARDALRLSAVSSDMDDPRDGDLGSKSMLSPLLKLEKLSLVRRSSPGVMPRPNDFFVVIGVLAGKLANELPIDMRSCSPADLRDVSGDDRIGTVYVTFVGDSDRAGDASRRGDAAGGGVDAVDAGDRAGSGDDTSLDSLLSSAELSISCSSLPKKMLFSP